MATIFEPCTNSLNPKLSFEYYTRTKEILNSKKNCWNHDFKLLFTIA